MSSSYLNWQEEFEDTKGVIRIRKSKKDKQHNDKKKRTKGQTTIYKTLHRKPKHFAYIAGPTW
jgi:hypothetical protein